MPARGKRRNNPRGAAAAAANPPPAAAAAASAAAAAAAASSPAPVTAAIVQQQQQQQQQAPAARATTGAMTIVTNNAPVVAQITAAPSLPQTPLPPQKVFSVPVVSAAANNGTAAANAVAAAAIPINLLPTVPIPPGSIATAAQVPKQQKSTTTMTVTAVNGSAAAAVVNSPPVSTCQAEIVSNSLKVLRGKGSSFLRTHASKHGITNASRKLTGDVLKELTEHYTKVHGVQVVADGPATAATAALTEITAVPSANDIVARLSNGHGVKGKKQQQQQQQVQAQVQPAIPATATIIASSADFLNGGIVQQQPQQPQVLQIQLPQHPLPQTQILLPQQPQQQHITYVSNGQPVTVTALPTTASGAAVPTAIAQIQHPMKPTQVLQQQPQQQQPPQLIVFPTKPVTPPGTTSVTNSMAGGSVTIAPVSQPQQVVVQQQQKVQHHQQQQQSNGSAANGCTAALMAKTRNELASCGTSTLRPEAAAHKVHNASRKPKEQVVDELWRHYVSCHSKELNVGSTITFTPITVSAGDSVGPPPPAKKPKTTLAQVAAVAEGFLGAIVDDDDENGRN